MYVSVHCSTKRVNFRRTSPCTQRLTRNSKPSSPLQALTLVSWGINTAAIFAGGRLDTELSKGNKPSGEAKDEQPLPVVRYFMPAGWAFAIWGPIILGW